MRESALDPQAIVGRVDVDLVPVLVTLPGIAVNRRQPRGLMGRQVVGGRRVE